MIYVDSFTTTLDALSEVRQWVQSHWPHSDLSEVQLIIGELSQNIIRHGFEGGSKDHEFWVELHTEDRVVVLSDTGPAWSIPANDKPAEEGGHGMKIVHNLSTSVTVARRDNRNITEVRLKPNR